MNYAYKDEKFSKIVCDAIKLVFSYLFFVYNIDDVSCRLSCGFLRIKEKVYE